MRVYLFLLQVFLTTSEADNVKSAFLFCATPPLKFPSFGGVAVERSETDGVVKNGQ